MGTGQRSSDDEVSKLILLDREREFFLKKTKMSEYRYLLIEERLYSICRTVTYSFSNCCYG